MIQVWNLAEPNQRERMSFPNSLQLWVLALQSICTETKEIWHTKMDSGHWTQSSIT